MTMLRAVALLVFSIVITAVGILLIVVRVNEGVVNPNNPSVRTGAFTGDAAATPTGNDLPINRSGAAATITAAARQITAAAATASAVKTPFAATPGTGRVSAVGVGEAVTVGTSRITVLQVADPEPPGLFRTDAGKRRVALEIKQEALADGVRYHFVEFKLRDSAGNIYTWTITNGEPPFQNGTLPAGGSRQGWISFQVPTGAVLDALIFQPITAPAGTPIVDLR